LVFLIVTVECLPIGVHSSNLRRHKHKHAKLLFKAFYLIVVLF